MTRPSLPARGAYGAATLLLAIPLLGGCGAGQQAETSLIRPVTTGVSGDVGDIALRNVYLQPAQGDQVPQGGDAALWGTIINKGTDADQLTGIDSDVASAQSAGGNVQLPPGQVVTFAPAPGSPGSADVRLSGFTQAVRTGQNIRLTFHFANAGDLDLLVPVESPTTTTATSTPIPTGTPGEAGSPSESPTEVPISSSPSPSPSVLPTASATSATASATATPSATP